jgi:alpha-ketoglutarate-dependent taurine dioxygenase
MYIERLHESLSVQAAALPHMIVPVQAGDSLVDAVPALHDAVREALRTTGGVLFRGFAVPAVEAFQQFAASFGHPLLKYEFASTPRSAVASEKGVGVYTSTEYPAHQHIPLHNEQAYTREWPMKIWFHCVTASPEGGETPIADSRAIYRRMPASIRARFEPGILYVRNYGEFDVPWQTVFNTDSRADVEAYCLKSGIQWAWKDDGELRTTQLCQAIETHPVTGERVWFNQAHLFHASNLQPEVRESLEDILGADNLPRNTYFADGRPIPDADFDVVRSVLDAETVSFPWEAGDVLMLDNMLVAHARAPFKGPRKVVVAMAEPHGNLGRF